MTTNNTRRKRRYMMVIITILVAFTSSLFLYNYAIDYTKQVEKETITQAENAEFDKIWDHLQNLLSLANLNASNASSDIERDIKSEFKDLNKLKVALDKKDPECEQQIHDIFARHTEGNYLNGIDNKRNAFLILSGDGWIKEDYTVDPNTDEDVYSNKQFAKYLDSTYNKELFKTALFQIRNHSNSIIAIEPVDPETKDHIMIDEISYSNLKKIYENEGIYGLRSYEFLVPVYITDTGDIFGQKDIIAGEPQQNHKFIIIQTFNLYDQIIKGHPTYQDKVYKKQIAIRYNQMINVLHILGIVICVSIIVSILYIFSLYNVAATRPDISEHIDSEEP